MRARGCPRVYGLGNGASQATRPPSLPNLPNLPNLSPCAFKKRASSKSSPPFLPALRFFTVATARDPFPLLLLAAASPAAWPAAGRLPARLDLASASASTDDDDDDEDDEDDEEDEDDAMPFMDPVVEVDG